jgi:hypothetical protein
MATGLTRVLALLPALLLGTLPAAGGAMEFRPFTQQGVTVLLAQGEIVPGDARRLAAALSRHVIDGATILLDSPGGNVGESLDLGMMIRDRRLATAVASGAICASACVFVLAGGEIRDVAQGARIGVHMASLMYDDEYIADLKRLLGRDVRASIDDKVRVIVALNEQSAGQIMAAIANYLARMGISMALLFPTTDTSAIDIHWLSRAELRDYNLANGD